MSRNGSGTYSLPAGNPVVTGTTISSTWANTTLTDIANAITGSLASDGQTTASGNLNMGTNKIVNAGDPTAQQDVSTKYYTDTAIATSAADVLATVTPAYVSDKVNTATGYFQVPQGTVAQRPATPLNGIVRYNTDLGFYEGYIDGDWVRFQTYSEGVYSATYLVVAGGGGGSGSNTGGGGGGGGYLTGTTTLTPGIAYNLIVGGGGANQAQGTGSSFKLGSVFLAQSIGGGYGGTYVSGAGGSGGSGGGGSYSNDSNPGGAGGSGTVGQGNNGYGGGAFNTSCGGGGGAGAAASGGNGATGASNTITGSAIYYAGGGCGYPGGSTGGAGGGGGPTTSGSTNTGGGAGGGGGGAAGGSGVVILSVPTANYSGTTTGSPTVTTNGSQTVIKFTASGTYTA